MIKKLIFSTLLLTMFSTISFAQGSKLKRAKAAMESLNYVGAIEMYNQILEKDDNAEAKIQLAECYRKISDSENSEYWYGQVVRLPEAEAIHKLHYGQALQRNGKCDLAREWYEQFIREVPGDIRGQYLARACDYQDELMTKSAGIFEISHMDFNSSVDDFSPTIRGDEIIFASERDKGSSVKRAHCWTGNPFLELYKVKAKGSGEDCKSYETSKATKFSKKLNSKFHDASVGFNNDESKIFFTRNNIDGKKVGKSDDGIIKLKVFSADVSGDDFSNIEGLPFNSDEYSVAHPTLNGDGTNLYFASDMPGGFGGMDLYVSEAENGRWGPPLNLGPMVNTEGNEVFPFYNAKDSKLYFSSDGQIGIGGLDIYHITEQEDGEFTLPENIGYPVNTISDDFGIVFDKEGANGFFSSDREGGVGRDDIYSFCKIAAPVEIFVYDENTGEPIEGALVINDCTGTTLTTDSEGKAVVEMKLNECCTFAASSEGYEDNEQEGCTTEVMAGETVFVEIPLGQETLYLLEGVVFDQNSGLPLEGASVMLESDCEDEEFEEIVTDATGRFEFPLGSDCCYTVKAGKDGYFGNPIEGQCTRGLTEATTLQANLNLAPIGAGGPAPVGTNPVIADNGQPITSTVGRGGPCDIYKDMDKGLYVSAETGEPFTGDCGGVSYVNGNPQGGALSGTTTTTMPTTTTSSTTFEPSGTAYTDANAGYLMHVYYDFNRAYLRDESTPELEKLCTMMKNQPDLVVEIASHTDSRGSNSYNYRLSQRRAEAVTRYLCEVCGISKDRLVPRGYGETKNVNQCANKVPCSEKEHQMNRRTEFRVIGCLSCYDNSETKLSAPNPNTKVSNCSGCPF